MEMINIFQFSHPIYIQLFIVKVMEQGIKVLIRFKNFRSEEEAQETQWRFLSSTQCQLGDETKIETYYKFDRVFVPTMSQAELYQIVGKEKIEQLLSKSYYKGYNGAILAYGATSSGKTFTLLGSEKIEKIYSSIPSEAVLNDENVMKESGIIPRSFRDLIENLHNVKAPEMGSVTLKCSYLEVYQEMIFDLLGDRKQTQQQGFAIQQRGTENQQSLRIRELPHEGVSVVGIEERQVDSVNQLIEILGSGTKRRSISCTLSNARSSRSHTIFTVELTLRWKDQTTRTSKLHLVDLSGSERLAKTTADNKTIEETKKINQSLSCLGLCIMALSSKQKRHIPYRDSKLTFLLKECLGGNSSTSFICTASPAVSETEKSIATLRFAQRAKKIVNRVKINIKLSYAQMEKLIENMRQEINKMKSFMSLQGVDYQPNFEELLNAYQLQKEDSNDSDQFTRQMRRCASNFHTLKKRTHKHNRSSLSLDGSDEDQKHLLDDVSHDAEDFQEYLQVFQQQRITSSKTSDISTSTIPFPSSAALRSFQEELYLATTSNSNRILNIDIIEENQNQGDTYRSAQRSIKKKPRGNLVQQDMQIFENANTIQPPDQEAIKKRESCCQVF